MKTEIKGILVMVMLMVGTVTSTIKADMRYNTSISACCARCLDYCAYSIRYTSILILRTTQYSPVVQQTRICNISKHLAHVVHDYNG